MNLEWTPPAGMLADMLIGALGMIGFSWAASPVSTELEIVREGVNLKDGKVLGLCLPIFLTIFHTIRS